MLRRPGLRLAGIRVSVRGQHVHRGLVRAQGRLGGQHGLYRVIEPGIVQPLAQPGVRLIHEPGRDWHAEEHADQVRGPLGGHVPVGGQQHRRRVHPRPVRHAARMRPGRRGGDRDLPAARAGQRRQQPLGDGLADRHVPDLRPRLPGRARAPEAGPAPRALRRRACGLALVRVRVAPQAAACVAGLPAPLAVLAPFPLGLLAVPALGLAALPRPDGFLRRWGPRVGAIHPQPPLQLGDL